MGTLLWNLALCMFVAVMPALLLVYTVEFMRQHEQLVDRMPLILLNVLFALSITAAVQDRQVPTLTAWTTTGYMIAGAILVLIVSGTMLWRVWRKLHARARRLIADFREEQPTLSQSFLPH